MGEGLRLLREKEMDPGDVRLSPEHFAALIRMNEEDEITNAVAKEIFAKAIDEDLDPESYVKANGLMTMRDDFLLRETVKKVIAENEKSVTDYKNGKEKALGYLVGQTMKAVRGQVLPAAVTAMLKEELNA